VGTLAALSSPDAPAPRSRHPRRATRAESQLPKNAGRREDLETDAQEAQDLAAKCQRMATGRR
jgi:hypothetical protein